MTTYRFAMRLSYQEFYPFYLGKIKQIIVRTEQGLRLQLPAERFRPFLTSQGIQGQFELIINENNKIESLIQL